MCYGWIIKNRFLVPTIKEIIILKDYLKKYFYNNFFANTNETTKRN